MMSYRGIIYAVLAFAVAVTGCNNDSDVIGVNDLTKYGAIKLTFEGKKPDGEPFRQTLNYNFVPAHGLVGEFSYMETEEDDRYFQVIRFTGSSLAGEGDGDSYAYFGLYVDESDEENLRLEMEGFYIRTTFISNGNKYFNLNSDIGEYVDAEGIENYSYDEATGKLRFTFNAVVPYYDNSTGHGLVVTGEVNAQTYEHLGSNDR